MSSKEAPHLSPRASPAANVPRPHQGDDKQTSREAETDDTGAEIIFPRGKQDKPSGKAREMAFSPKTVQPLRARVSQMDDGLIVIPLGLSRGPAGYDSLS